MKNDDLISVIVPFYKGENYISSAIDSILNQTYTNFELLLIENGIKDNSEQIIQKFNDKRIRYFYLDKANVSNARNFGISQSKGNFIYFMDGDDTLEPNLLEICITNIKKKHVDLILFNFNKVTKNSIIKVSLPWKNEIINKKEICSKLIPTIIYRENGEDSIMGTVWRIFTYKKNLKDIKFDINVKYAEDMLFVIQLYNRINSIYVLDDALYNYTLSSSSTLNSSNLEMINYSILFHKILKNTLQKENLYKDKIKLRFYKNQGKMYTNAISFASRSSDKKSSKKCIKNIVNLFNKDNYNYLKLSYPLSIKISFMLMKLRMSCLLYYLYKIKEKARLSKFNK